MILPLDELNQMWVMTLREKARINMYFSPENSSERAEYE